MLLINEWHGWNKGVGYAICLIDIYMGMYYNTIIGWAVYYFFASFTSQLPWTSCDNVWNTEDCMSVTNVNFTANQTTPAKEFFELIFLILILHL